MNLADKLVTATKKMYEDLDALSQDIRYLESSLQKAGLKVPFEMQAGPSSILRWAQDPNSRKGKKWRLMLFDSESQTSSPLLETQGKIRMNYREHFDEFIKAFIKEVGKIDTHSLRIEKTNSAPKVIVRKESDGAMKEMYQEPEYEDDLPY